MDSATLYDLVKERGGMASSEEAQKAVQNVLSSLVPLLSYDELDELTSQLPDDLRARMGKKRGMPDDLIDREVFIGRLVNELDTEYGYDESLGGLDLSSTYADNDASRKAQAVFSVLRSILDSTTAQHVRARLPGDIRDWWDAS